MKRQLVWWQYGFTLIELMIVITIFGVLVVATNIFTYTPQSESEKADRMMVAISSRIKSELQNISLWRMPKRDGKIAKTVKIEIGTGGMITSYMTGASSNTEISSWSFRAPFFDTDRKYEIKSVIWTGSTTNPIGYSWTWEFIIDANNFIFSGAGISGSWYTLLEIRVWYNTKTRKVIIDRRTGKIIEKKF